MHLIFSQKWPKGMGKLSEKENFIIEKIWKGHPANSFSKLIAAQAYSAIFDEYWDGYTGNQDINPKIHILLSGASGKEGMNISPIVLNYSECQNEPFKFQFTPSLTCSGVQEIEIYHSDTSPPRGSGKKIKVDGKCLIDQEVQQLAINEGFPDIEAFFLCFNKSFKGQIIHWTDLRY